MKNIKTIVSTLLIATLLLSTGCQNNNVTDITTTEYAYEHTTECTECTTEAHSEHSHSSSEESTESSKEIESTTVASEKTTESTEESTKVTETTKVAESETKKVTEKTTSSKETSKQTEPATKATQSTTKATQATTATQATSAAVQTTQATQATEATKPAQSTCNHGYRLANTTCVWKTYKEPTCTEDGYEAVWCTVCNQWIQFTNGNFSLLMKSERAAHILSNLHAKELSDVNNAIGNRTDITMTDDIRVDVVSTPDCCHNTTETNYVCKHCNTVIKNRKASTGYDYTNHTNVTYTEGKTATCKDDGYNSFYYCSGCHMASLTREGLDTRNNGSCYPANSVDAAKTMYPVIIKKSNDYCVFNDGTYSSKYDCEVRTVTKTCKICSRVTTDNVAGVGHTLDAGVVTTEATLVKEGKIKYTCTKCGWTTTETVKAKDITEADYANIEAAILKYWNISRVNAGLSPVTVDATLQAFSKVRIGEIAVKHSHERPNLEPLGCGECFGAICNDKDMTHEVLDTYTIDTVPDYEWLGICYVKMMYNEKKNGHYQIMWDVYRTHTICGISVDNIRGVVNLN